MKRHAETGFTLIEILLVLGVIAILSVLSMAAVARGREKGRQSACLSNIRALGLACHMYADDNDGYLPPYTNSWPIKGTWVPYWGDPKPDLLHAALMPYVQARKTWFCPSDPFAGSDSSKWGITHLYSSYAFNLTTTRARLMIDGWHMKPGKIMEPSVYPLIYDCNNEFFTPPELREQPASGGCEHFHGWNICYLDGHAEFVPCAY